MSNPWGQVTKDLVTKGIQEIGCLKKILSHREVYFPRGVRRHVFCSECNRAVSSSSDQSDAHKLMLIPGA